MSKYESQTANFETRREFTWGVYARSYELTLTPFTYLLMNVDDSIWSSQKSQRGTKFREKARLRTYFRDAMVI
jgi:hypothetical protein